MNTRKLAEALRKLQGHDAMTAQRVADCFGEAAAACEEEGMDDILNVLKNNEERIAALEAKDEQLYRYITEKPSIGQFVELWDRFGALEAKVGMLSDDAAVLGSRFAAHAAPPVGGVIGGDPPPAPEEECPHLRPLAPPAAPEERCVYGCACVYPNRRGCDCDCHPAAASAAPSGREERNRCGTEEAVSAPSPEQAQETWPCQCKCGCKITRTKAEGGSTFTVCDACWNGHTPPEQAQETHAPLKMTPHPRETCRALEPPCVSCAPPEQARRTWFVHPGKNTMAFYECQGVGCNDCKLWEPPFLVTQLRPGERIVSGEEVRVGVLVHKHTYTDSIWCEGRTCEPGIVVGIVYEVEPRRAPASGGEMRAYPHMCRDGHVEIGHADSEHELCPLCRSINEADHIRARLAEAVRLLEDACGCWDDLPCKHAAFLAEEKKKG